LYLTFLSNPNGPLVNYKEKHAAHEGDIFMSTPLIILAIFSIFFGFFTKDLFIGIGTNFFFDNAIYIHYMHEINLDTEFALPILIKILPLIITILVIILFLYKNESKLSIITYYNNINLYYYNIYCFLSQRFFVELIYNKYISEYILNVGSQTTKVLDKGSVEYIGPYGLEKGLLYISNVLNKLDSGKLTYYSLFILCGLIIYIFF
jgi:NADH-ubiquinone oxidoreductase chain 5